MTASRAIVQIEVAEADAALRAARAGLLEAADAVWSASDERTRVLARNAAIHAVTTSAAVVDRAYTLGGGSALRSGSPLQRRLRDVHAATQHAIVSRAALQPIGRLLLGLPADTLLF